MTTRRCCSHVRDAPVAAVTCSRSLDLFQPAAHKRVVTLQLEMLAYQKNATKEYLVVWHHETLEHVGPGLPLQAASVVLSTSTTEAWEHSCGQYMKIRTAA